VLPESTIDEVKRLLAEGRLSQRKIALQTGVSRGTVGAIAGGRRREQPAKPAAFEDEVAPPSGPPERCSRCGALVYLPCRLCRMRALLRKKRFPRRPERPLGPLRLELNDNHYARYLEIRARCCREKR